MREYPAYTIDKIEEELTWEQVDVMSNAIIRRYERQQQALGKATGGTAGSTGGSRGGRVQRDWDVEDLIENRVPGFGVELREVS